LAIFDTSFVGYGADQSGFNEKSQQRFYCGFENYDLPSATSDNHEKRQVTYI